MMTAVLFLALSYALFHLVHTFYWHPLARFPGPPLAALTRFYRTWIDCSPSRSFVHTLAALHAQYGTSLY